MIAPGVVLSRVTRWVTPNVPEFGNAVGVATFLSDDVLVDKKDEDILAPFMTCDYDPVCMVIASPQQPAEADDGDSRAKNESNTRRMNAACQSISCKKVRTLFIYLS
jgi:hypothetical protein